MMTTRRLCALLFLAACSNIQGFTVLPGQNVDSRRKLLQKVVDISGIGFIAIFPKIPRPALAYEPDPDPLQESLYLISRVQEATVLQERYINRKRPPLQKMKLTLRLVDRSYKLLDQITFCTQTITDTDNLLAATTIGNEAADRLQEAIDYVYAFPKTQDATAITDSQKDFVASALRDTREMLFEFEKYLPPDSQIKLQNARHRVEAENKLNKDEFDPDLVAEGTGVYDPIVLPWMAQKSA